LWLSFYPFKQDDYLDIVQYWLTTLGCPEDEIGRARTEALQGTLERGSRSGRVASQFAKDWAARQGHGRGKKNRGCRRLAANARRPLAAGPAPRGQKLCRLVGTAGRQARARRKPGAGACPRAA